MIVKKTPNCRKGGQKSYYLLTCDYASLEARLAAIDTFLNDCPNSKWTDKEAQKSMPDNVLYGVYKDGSDTSDLHSMTGFGTFCGSVHMKAIRVHDDVDNRDYVFAATSKCKVKRGNDEVIVKASELLPTDHIIEHCKK